MEEEKKAKQVHTVINLSAADESPAYPKLTFDRSGWVKFGEKNQFPQDIINFNSKSPVNKSIIESTVTYICGKGVQKSKGKRAYVGVPNSGETWDEVIERLAKDYKTFGGFYFQVIVNKGTTTVSLFHQDYSAVRIGQIDDTGKPLTFRIANDWKKTSGKNKPIELDVWPGSVAKAQKGQAYLYYYWDYEPGLNHYSIPGYYSAIEYIKADGSLGSFYNNSIDNGFIPSVVISMPSNPDQDEKAKFQADMEHSFAGSKGAASVVVLWGENDEVKPVITPYTASANADIYNNVEEKIFQKIISANRLSSPTLAGVSGSGNLSGNAAEIIDAYVLYNYTVIEKLRNKILEHLNKFTKINRTADLIIEDLDVLPKIRETEEGGETPTDEPASLSKKNGKFRRIINSLLNYGSSTD